MQARSKIPKTQTVRLLFQPAEEAPGGAPLMIEEGACSLLFISLLMLTRTHARS
jgi:metal-dependent amidase/aminoacylase/carboxypeptidase family protein